MTLSGNELSIANHDVRGFSNSFQNQTLKKSLQTDWPNTFSFKICEPGFVDIRFLVEPQRKLWWII